MEPMWLTTIESRRPTGVRWEIDGPHRDDPNEQPVDIFWLLEPPS